MHAQTSSGAGRAVATMVVASLAMVATLPGRTFGLGLITEPLIAELEISRVDFTMLNLWATLLGALFIWVSGPALDRVGIRWTAATVLGLFGAAVYWLSAVADPGQLFPVLVFMHGLGQCSLSLVAIAIVGKWFRRRLSVAMGVFAVVVANLFVGAILGAEKMVAAYGWRETWMFLAVMVIVLGCVAAAILREPEVEEAGDGEAAAEGMTLRSALGSPVLWVLTLGTGIYYFSFTGITLLSESVVRSFGFGSAESARVLAVMMGAGLLGNLGCGWLGQRVPVLKVFGGSLLVFSVCLFGYPQVGGSAGALYSVAAAMGIAGGAVTVVFFTGFAEIFGRRYLGRIQGVAQAVTVAAAGTGPLSFAWVFRGWGSYAGAFLVLAGLSLVAGIWALVLREPKGGEVGGR